MSARRCCVIGGGGFIGSPLVAQLITSGREVTVAGRAASPRRALPGGVRYLAGDYGDSRFLRMLLDDADEVVHLAYATVPQTSFDDPVGDIIANLPPSVALFAEASRRKLAKLVFVSSGGTVYGRAGASPIAEGHPTMPVSPYGITKLALEKYALMYRELEALPVVIVRPGNAYGPGQLPFSGQGFVATAIASVLEEREIALFGESGTVRDYVHVEDVAAGIASALTRGEPGACYNIGSGVGHSNRDIIELLRPLAAQAGIVPRTRVLPPRRFDVPANVLDSARLANDTGWRPHVALPEGLAGTWEWFRQGRREQADGGSRR